MNLPLEQALLFDVCDFYSGKAHEHFITENGKYKVINSKFVATEGETFKESNHSFLTAQKNDITMVMSDLPNGRALAKCYLVEEDDKYAVNQRVCILRSKGYNPKYLFYVLNRNPYFLSFNDGVSQTHLLNHVFEKCNLMITKNLDEQKAIAEALSDIDELILLTEREINKKINIKSSISDNLFSRVYLDSVQLRLRDIGFFYGGLSGKSGKDFGKGNSKYITFLNVINNVIADPNMIETVDIESNEKQNLVLTGDLLFNGSSETPEEVAFPSLVPSALNGLYLNSFCFGFRFEKTDSLDPLFFAHYLRSRYGRQFVSQLAQGSTRYNISKNALYDLVWNLPTIGNQIEIGKILSDLDLELSGLIKEKAKYQSLKQGMMNDLLTGKVRLV